MGEPQKPQNPSNARVPPAENAQEPAAILSGLAASAGSAPEATQAVEHTLDKSLQGTLGVTERARADSKERAVPDSEDEGELSSSLATLPSSSPAQCTQRTEDDGNHTNGPSIASQDPPGPSPCLDQETANETASLSNGSPASPSDIPSNHHAARPAKKRKIDEDSSVESANGTQRSAETQDTNMTEATHVSTNMTELSSPAVQFATETETKSMDDQRRSDHGVHASAPFMPTASTEEQPKAANPNDQDHAIEQSTELNNKQTVHPSIAAEPHPETLNSSDSVEPTSSANAESKQDEPASQSTEAHPALTPEEQETLTAMKKRTTSLATTEAELSRRHTTLLHDFTAIPTVSAMLPRTQDPADTDAALDAAKAIIKEHIRLLHDYNEIRDIGQGLMGIIAESRGVRIREVQEEYDISAKD